MILTIATTHQPATDLGFLLHKNPDNLRSVELPFGTAHVFYPEASADRCTAALLLEVDSVGLVRNRRTSGDATSLSQYVNDRPYVASSFMSAAIAKLFGTAMSGRSKDRPELAERSLPFEIHIPVLPCRGGEPILRRLFEPLGYTVSADVVPLDDRFPEWGPSRYLSATFSVDGRIADVLSHLYVLLPVLDDEKHYWVSESEIDKLIARGGTWLGGHPERELITRRYLRHQRQLMAAALERLLADEPPPADDEAVEPEDVIEERISLNSQRLGAVVAALKAAGARRVVDLGCGDGRLVRTLLGDPTFAEVVGVDVSMRALQRASRNLRMDQMGDRQRERISLFQSSLTYRDRRLVGFDAATLVEVIEHVEPERLPALERAVFGAARPTTVVVTTPNVEHNVRYETLPEGTLRHRDHRFEWTRAEFQEWTARVCDVHGYAVRHLPIGDDDPEVGPPTQMAVFTR